MASQRLDALRFPTEVVERTAALVRTHMYAANPSLSDAAIRRFVRRVGVDNLGRQFALRAADIVGSGLPKRSDENERFQARVASLLAERPPLSARDLALDGEDVIYELVAAGKLPRGSRGGPIVGEVLHHLLEQVTDDPAMNEPSRLRAAVRAFLTGALSDRAGVSHETS